MTINDSIEKHNAELHAAHHTRWQYLLRLLEDKRLDANPIVQKIMEFQIAIPSWALGTGGTRFGRFPGGGEPINLEQKIEDVGLLHALNQSCDSISLHIPWDIPTDYQAIHTLLKTHGLHIDSVNSNTFQDQPGQALSYKFGSLCHTDAAIREQAIQHNRDCIQHGVALHTRVLTVWLADGSNFPGQQHLRHAWQRTIDSLHSIYADLPADWTLLLEYKPYEPNFYSMVIPDWGTSYATCLELGKQAQVLVDLGHHLPNTNIEQIVGRLMHLGRLGGFHFNGSLYGDDDLTTGSMKPYQLFLIFNELVDAMEDPEVKNPPIAWMIDASHNTKDPLEDLLQSVDNLLNAYAKALLVDRVALQQAQVTGDVVMAEESLRDAFLIDTRSLVAEASYRLGGALHPLACFRAMGGREQRLRQRGTATLATGL